MNRLSTAARIAYADGSAPDWEDGGAGWSVALIGAGYVFADGDVFLDAIDPGDIIGTAPLAGNTILPDGACALDDTTVTAADGEIWAALWIFLDTGTPATSKLWGWFDTKPDDTPQGGTVSGGEVVIEWASTGAFRL